MEKIKVVEIILDLASRAGAETFFQSVCERLAKSSNIELSIICLWDNVHDSFSPLKELEGVNFYTLNKKRGVDFKAAKKLKRIIKKINPDIIHTHRSILMTYFLAFGSKKRHWKLVHTIHNVPTKESNAVTDFLRKIYIRKHNIWFVGISKTITSEFKKVFPKAEIITINNGIPLVECHHVANPEYDFINVARFSPQKNHRLLFDAFEQLSFKYQNLKLICVGNGELFEESRDYISNLSCKNQIILYGQTDNVYSLLEKSKCFILSSLYEGNPISILEAMNCGLPIIAPEVGGIPDVISNNINGFLFEVGNISQLAECMEKIITSENIIQTISKNNLLLSKQYSIDFCVKSYIDLFYDIISGRK